MKRLKKKNINTPKFYDGVWAQEKNLRPYYDAVRQRALIKHVRNTDSVLDVGCGLFGSCQYIAERTTLRSKLHAIDFSQTVKDYLEKSAGDRIAVRKSRVEVLPYADKMFHCVIAGEIIEHVEDPAGFASELCRVCKPGGTVTISTVDTTCENAIKHGEYIDHVWEFTKEDLTGFFEPYGKVEYSLVGDYHFLTCYVPAPVIITVDDFCETNHKIDLLTRIHDATGMVFNLFTIPGLCSREFIEKAKLIDWIDMIPHGWTHPTSRECQDWGREKCEWYISLIEPMGLTKGFKAPGWQISTAMYETLNNHGYWVADQNYNDSRRPSTLKTHYPEAGKHFHIGHMGGYNRNEIELNINHVMGLKGGFGFIKDIFG